MATRLIQLHDRGLASLERIGFAAEYFPSYVHTSDQVTHGHDILEANFIVRGTAHHMIGSTARRCPPGSLGIVNYGQEHSLRTDANGVELFNIYLDPVRHPGPDLPEPFAAMAAYLFPPAPQPSLPRGLTSFLQFPAPAPLAHLLHYCCAEQTSQASGYEQALTGAWRALLINCARQALEEGVDTLVADHSHWAPIEAVRVHLERDYTAPHRLDALATEAGLSEAYLCRRFKAYTGLSPFAYLAQCRIRAAMQQLRHSNRNVLDIAMSCGFNDIGHFNRKFRELANCTPTHYRSHSEPASRHLP